MMQAGGPPTGPYPLQGDRRRGEPWLDRWLTPSDLAVRWNVDRRTARDRLREMNRASGGRLYVVTGRRIRVLGRVLEREYPGALHGEGIGAAELRRLAARVDDHEQRLDGHERWIGAAADEIQTLRHGESEASDRRLSRAG